MKGEIHVLVGPSGSGKTSTCLQKVREARSKGRRVSGIVSQHRLREGARDAILARDLSTGETRVLALPAATTPEASVRTPRWSFDEGVLAWGNEVLRTAVPAEILVIDELGILEFERGQGWTHGLKLLDERQFEEAWITLRPSLEQAARQRWPDARWACTGTESAR